MLEVTAYQDDYGRLHKTKREAAISEFIATLQQIWGRLPDQRDKGDAVVIARILASGGNADIRTELIAAIRKLEDHESSSRREVTVQSPHNLSPSLDPKFVACVSD